MLKRLVCVAVVGMLVVACGGDDEEEKPAGQPGTTNKQSAVTATQGTINAVNGLTGSNAASSGTSSANLLGSAAQQTQNIVQPAAGGQTQGQSLAALAMIGDFLTPQANPPGYTGTCECTETSCTFTDCKGPQLTINGSFSWGGGKLKATGLKYVLNAAGGGATVDVTWTVDADMSIATTSIDGTFKTTGNQKTSAGGYNTESTWDNTLTFKQVTFASGSPTATGGSLNTKGTYTITVNGQTQTYNGNVDISFPAQ